MIKTQCQSLTTNTQMIGTKIDEFRTNTQGDIAQIGERQRELGSQLEAATTTIDKAYQQGNAAESKLAKIGRLGIEANESLARVEGGQQAIESQIMTISTAISDTHQQSKDLVVRSQSVQAKVEQIGFQASESLAQLEYRQQAMESHLVAISTNTIQTYQQDKNILKLSEDTQRTVGKLEVNSKATNARLEQLERTLDQLSPLLHLPRDIRAQMGHIMSGHNSTIRFDSADEPKPLPLKPTETFQPRSQNNIVCSKDYTVVSCKRARRIYHRGKSDMEAEKYARCLAARRGCETCSGRGLWGLWNRMEEQCCI
jgi:chromosome segregation ATPase